MKYWSVALLMAGCADSTEVRVSTVEAAPRQVGEWRGQLDSPGGAIHFGFNLTNDAGDWNAELTDGIETILLPNVALNDGEMVVAIDHYDATIRFRFDGPDPQTVYGGAPPLDRLRGEWRKRRGPDEWVTLPFGAVRQRDVSEWRPGAEPALDIGGRWAMVFGDDDAAIGQFQTGDEAQVSGTILTPTGDYRYLTGRSTSQSVNLSVFDGAHAFLFRATPTEDGGLEGTFYSGSHWQEPWVAHRDDTAQLPDANTMTTVSDAAALGSLAYPDLEGQLRRLDDPAFAGKARIITLFGSWCPNCHDEAALLVELQQEFGERGLSILGLAFELTDEPVRNAAVILRYQERHGANWPVLIAGAADKARASEQFPVLDAVRSFPTTLFIDETGRVVSVHTGFSGPATGDAYTVLRDEWRHTIESMLTATN